jgi:hypothetical protein
LAGGRIDGLAEHPARFTTPGRSPGGTRRYQEAIIRFSTSLSALAVGAALACTAAPAVAAPPAGDQAGVNICNEAENSFRGGYTVAGGIVDPNPPAFLRGSQMRVGNGNGEGLLNAAQHSPALRECGPTDGGPPTDDGGDEDAS